MTAETAAIPASPGITPTAPDLGRLDLLGRMPIPLRRAFKAGLDRTVAAHRTQTGIPLKCCFLSGGEWYRPFDTLADSPNPPDMLVTPLYHDILSPALLAHYGGGTPPADKAPWHPACVDGGLRDPAGVFHCFAVIPFVFLIDERRLRGRAAPRTWADLLDPRWAGDIVFGGWRPNEQVPYQDFNTYLLMSLYQEFGAEGLEAFARNVRHLQHNVRTATQAGSNSPQVGAIAILPWLQAELCPRRERTRVAWPEDGALAMPIGYLLKPGMEARLAPLVDYVTGEGLGAVLAHNCYPPTRALAAASFPEGARLKWPGWEYIRSHDLAAESRRAAELFFAAWDEPPRRCACS